MADRESTQHSAMHPPLMGPATPVPPLLSCFPRPLPDHRPGRDGQVKAEETEETLAPPNNSIG